MDIYDMYLNRTMETIYSAINTQKDKFIQLGKDGNIFFQELFINYEGIDEINDQIVKNIAEKLLQDRKSLLIEIEEIDNESQINPESEYLKVLLNEKSELLIAELEDSIGWLWEDERKKSKPRLLHIMFEINFLNELKANIPRGFKLGAYIRLLIEDGLALDIQSITVYRGEKTTLTVTVPTEMRILIDEKTPINVPMSAWLEEVIRQAHYQYRGNK